MSDMVPDTHRIGVTFREGHKDGAGERKKRELADAGIEADSVRTIHVYTIDREMTQEQVTRLAGELFSEQITQVYGSPDELLRVRPWNWMVDVGLQPGVKDNVGDTSREAIELMEGERFAKGERVYVSKFYLIEGDIPKEEMLRAGEMQVFGNKNVERWEIVSADRFRKEGYTPPVPRASIKHTPGFRYIDLDIPFDGFLSQFDPGRDRKKFERYSGMIGRFRESGDADGQLDMISDNMSLSLDRVEMEVIREYFSRPDVIAERKAHGLDPMPTDVEMETLGQTWSEHCKHKIFNADIDFRTLDAEGAVVSEERIDSLFNTYIKRATRELQEELDWVVSTLWDNAGVMKFNDRWNYNFKCETHNSPTKKYPYGGAETGNVGVFRDPDGTGIGHWVILGGYGFCTGDPFYDGELVPELTNAQILEGTRWGVEDGANQHGVATPIGFTFHDNGFMGKPAIYVWAYGFAPAEINGKPSHEKRAEVGDLIVNCGGRVGKDGIHGVTQASMESDERITAGHVQTGDPFTQRKTFAFLREARDMGLYTCKTDTGGGGWSSSVGEMAQNFGRHNEIGGAFGCEVWLERAPLKYEGLDPWEIWISESQERVIVSVPEENREEFMELSRKYGVESTVIGQFNDTGKLHLKYGKDTVGYLDLDFLHNGVPKKHMEAEWTGPEDRGLKEPELEPVGDHTSLLRQTLGRLNISGKEYISRQYDHEVQGMSVIKPLVGKDSDVNSDAAVIKPLEDSWEGMATSAAINPKLSEIDAYHMAAWVIDEAIRRVVSVGGRPDRIGFNDNFCWPNPIPDDDNPDAKYKLAQLVRANQALYDYTTGFKAPPVSGKDSMSMDGDIPDKDGVMHRVSAPPTLLFTACTKVDDVRKCVTMDVKMPGDLVYVLGLTKDERGGSEFYEMHDEVGLNVPQVDRDRNMRLYWSLFDAMDRRLVESCHGVYKAGLGVSLARTSFAGGYGLDVDLSGIAREGAGTDDAVLYSESSGRLVVSVDPRKRDEFEAAMAGNACSLVGTVREDDRFLVRGLGGNTIIDDSVYELKRAWQGTFDRFNYHPEEAAA